jgi:hypothetical protein
MRRLVSLVVTAASAAAALAFAALAFAAPAIAQEPVRGDTT